MCRSVKKCSELNDDVESWDKYCPLKPPIWIDDEISIFSNAIDFFSEGNKDACLEIISSIRNEEITDWYIEHGQMSGMHRKNALNLKREKSISGELRDPLRAPKKYQNKVFLRDGYKCRYCGNRLISQSLMKLFIKCLDHPSFKKGPNNLATHGIIHATWPVADHVIPWVIGGRTNLENLVASCGACNYGKAGYTVEQIGIYDPLNFPPILSAWDGLESKIESVNKQKTV